MAPGLKGWFVLAALLLTGVGVWLVPPGRVPVPGESRMTRAHQAWAELEEGLRLEGWTYQHLQRRDSLIGELQVAAASGDRILLGTPPETADSLRTRLEASVSLHLRRLGVEQPAIPLGVFFIPRTQFSHPELATRYPSGGGSLEYYVARGDEAPFCIIAVPFQDESSEDRPPWSADPLTRKIKAFADLDTGETDPVNTLGLCRHFVQHGPPGQEIFDWLQERTFLFGRGVPGRNHFRYYPVDTPPRGPFGALSYSSRSFTPQGLACLQGLPDACLKIMLEPEQGEDPSGNRRQYVPELRATVVGSPVDFLASSRRTQTHFGPFDEYIFAALEDEFGSDRFGRFWRSPLEPEAAFQEAFGQPMDQWVMGWIRGYLRDAPRGPGVPIQATFLAFLTLGLLAGGAVRMGRR